MSYEISSCCRGCNFSQTEKNEDGKSLQTGCELGRVEKFKSLGAEVHLDESENGEFFTISRFCTCYRPEEWIITLSEEENEQLISAFDQIGDIIIVRIPDSLVSKKQIIGKTLLEKNLLHLSRKTLFTVLIVKKMQKMWINI